MSSVASRPATSRTRRSSWPTQLGQDIRGRKIFAATTVGSGKSTLAAALARVGWGDLSDEAAVIDPNTKLVHAYSRPIALRTPPDAFFPGLAPITDDPALLMGERPRTRTACGPAGRYEVTPPPARLSVDGGGWAT